MSVEADLAFRDDPDAAKADRVDGAIGAVTVPRDARVLRPGCRVLDRRPSPGCQDRLELLERKDSYPGYARCLEPHDLVVAKLVAGREKDLSFATALIAHDLVDPAILRDPAATVDRPGAVIAAVLDRVVFSCAA